MSTPAPKNVTLVFDLHELPTVQHKAGLAGLVLQIQSMKARMCDPNLIPVLEDLTESSARVAFSSESTQGLFDDLYAANIETVSSASKWAGATPKGEELKAAEGSLHRKDQGGETVPLRHRSAPTPFLESTLTAPDDNPGSSCGAT